MVYISNGEHAPGYPVSILLRSLVDRTIVPLVQHDTDVMVRMYRLPHASRPIAIPAPYRPVVAFKARAYVPIRLDLLPSILCVSANQTAL